MLICLPDDMMEVDSYGHTFSGCYLSVSRTLVEQLFLLSPQGWKTRSTIKKVHWLTLEAEDVRLQVG